VKLEQIGFYTLSDDRAARASAVTPLSRCEMLLTNRCNFRCPYCRSAGSDDIEYEEAARILRIWASHRLFAVRFSGGEPLLYRRLPELVQLSKDLGIKRIAVSSNGSLPIRKYLELIDAGVNDFSISLDACCAEDGFQMSGGVVGAWEKVIANIELLSQRVYLTVGIVATTNNIRSISNTVAFADTLGVRDIRVIPAAQDGKVLCSINISQHLLDRHPILKYRIDNFHSGRMVRGLSDTDNNKCPLVLDDMAVCGKKHYPCIIYLREGGQAIGVVDETVRQQRLEWYQNHNTHEDPICSHNCLDVCVDYNNRHRELNKENHE